MSSDARDSTPYLSAYHRERAERSDFYLTEVLPLPGWPAAPDAEGITFTRSAQYVAAELARLGREEVPPVVLRLYAEHPGSDGTGRLPARFEMWTDGRMAERLPDPLFVAAWYEHAEEQARRAIRHLLAGGEPSWRRS